jgi:hypothetical protein
MKKKIAIFMSILLVLLLTVFSACSSSPTAVQGEEEIYNITLSFDWPVSIQESITEEEFNAATQRISEDSWTVNNPTFHRYPADPNLAEGSMMYVKYLGNNNTTYYLQRTVTSFPQAMADELLAKLVEAGVFGRNGTITGDVNGDGNPMINANILNSRTRQMERWWFYYEQGLLTIYKNWDDPDNQKHFVFVTKG